MDANIASNIPPLLIAVPSHDAFPTPVQRSSKNLQYWKDEDILEYSYHQQHREGSLRPEAPPILPHTSDRASHGAGVKRSAHDSFLEGDDAASCTMRHSKTVSPPANLIGIGPESPTLISSPNGVLVISTGLSPIKNPRSEFSGSSSPSPSRHLSPTFNCHTSPTIAPMHAGMGESPLTGDVSSQRSDNSGHYPVKPFHALETKSTEPTDSEYMGLCSSAAVGLGGGSRGSKSLGHEQRLRADLGSRKADLFDGKHGHPTLSQRSSTPSDSSSSTVGGVSQQDFANILSHRSPVATGNDALKVTPPQVHRDSDNGLPDDTLQYNQGRLFTGGSSGGAFPTTVVGPNPYRGVFYPGGSHNSDMGTCAAVSGDRSIICFSSSAGDDVNRGRSTSCHEAEKEPGEDIPRNRGKAIPAARRFPAADEFGNQNLILRTACNECTLRKVRCDGEQPCLSCRKKGVACTFSASQKQGRQARTRKNGRLLEVRPLGGSTSTTFGHTGPVVDADEAIPLHQAGETLRGSSPAPLEHLPHGFSIADYPDTSRGAWTKASRWGTASSSPSLSSRLVTGRLGSGSRGRGFRGGSRGRARGGATIIRSRSTASAAAGAVATVGVSKRGVGRGRGGSGSRGRGRAGVGMKRYRLSDEGDSIGARPFWHGHRLPRRAQASQRQVMMAAAGLFESDDNDGDNEDGDEKRKHKKQDFGRGNGDRAGKVCAVDLGNASENDIPAVALVSTTTEGGVARVDRDGIGDGIKCGMTDGTTDGIEDGVGNRIGIASRIGDGMIGYGGTSCSGEGGAIAEAHGGDVNDSHVDNDSEGNSDEDDDDDAGIEDAESSSEGEVRDEGPLNDDECDDIGSGSLCVIDARLPRPSQKEKGKEVWSQLRKACDRCTSKKVKCDGKEGCFQCKRVGAVCHFSICRRSGPRDSNGQKKIGATGPIIPRNGYEKVTARTGACRTSSPCPFSFTDGRNITEHYHCRSPLCEYASKTMEKLMEHKRTYHPE